MYVLDRKPSWTYGPVDFPLIEAVRKPTPNAGSWQPVPPRVAVGEKELHRAGAGKAAGVDAGEPRKLGQPVISSMDPPHGSMALERISDLRCLLRLRPG